MKNITVKLLEVAGKNPSIIAVAKPYKNENADLNLLKKVTKVLKHESLLEQIELWFEVDGSSRLELQEHARHRTASMCVESSRYTLDKMLDDYNNYGTEFDYKKHFVYPLQDQLSNNDFQKLNICITSNIENALNKMSLLKNEGIKNDYLKYLLPENKRTSFVWKIDLKNFLHFIKLRTDKNAHFEIRHIANLMLDEVKKDDFLRELM
jgi:thymidylate synthase (FAD)